MSTWLRSIWRAIRADGLALTGLGLLLGIITIAAAAPLLAPHDPNEINERVEGVALLYDGASWGEPEIVADQPLNAATLLDDAAGVAVGEAGRIAVLADEEWDDAAPVTDVSLVGLDADSSTVIAVGAQGTAVHGQVASTPEEWEVQGLDTDAVLRDVSVAGDEAALAVGDDGTVAAWDATHGWELLDSGVDAHLRGVRLTGPGEGVVVGEQGTVLAYADGALDPVPNVTFRDLLGVDVADDGTVLLVGERGTILRHPPVTETGGELSEGGALGAWEEMRSPESRVYEDVRFLGGADTALALGERGIAVGLEDGVWERVDTGYSRSLLGMGSADGRVLAVGTEPYQNELAAPSADHWFGTTHLGRDIFSQTVWGSRTALLVGGLAALMVTLIGTNIGLIAGYFKGRTGGLLMRFVDVMYALPLEAFALILVLIFRPSLLIVILAIGLVTWRTTARLIRAQVLSLAERPFVKAARVAGASDWRILYVHIMPNVLPLVFLQLAVAMAFAITAEATLSFLGLGPPGVYSWGGILHEARLSGAWRVAWWWIIPPGIMIMITVVAVFFIARALEVLSNPRLATRS